MKSSRERVGATSPEAIDEVVERHADEAAFLWTRREAALVSPAYGLDDLGEIDDRLESHLDGLRTAGDLGWERSRGEVEAGTEGALFAATILAIERGDPEGLSGVIAAGARDNTRARAIVSALGFFAFEDLDTVWGGLFAEGATPLHLFVGLSGHAIHRRDPGERLVRLATSEDERLRARAFRAGGELGRIDQAPVLREGLSDEREACRFWAAWSGALLGQAWATPVLVDLAVSGSAFAERAADMAVRGMAPAEARSFVTSLGTAGGSGGAASEGSGGAAAGPGGTARGRSVGAVSGRERSCLRAAIGAAGALGDPGMLGWLSEHLSETGTARLAAFAIARITGADVRRALRGHAPPGFVSGPSDDPEDEDVAMDPDEDLPWPDVEALRKWVLTRSLPEGTRHLFGRPLSPAWLSRVLRAADQATRASAAVDLRLLRAEGPLFEVRAPARAQLASLPA